MCKFASFILTKDREYWSSEANGSGEDSHESIIAEHKLEALDRKSPPNLVRVEIKPSDTPRDLSTWVFVVDQDVFPEWTFRGDPDLEKRGRDALTRRAEAQGWFAEVISNAAVTGYAGTATAGDDGTATAGYAGTATAGDEGTATAGDDGILNIRWWDGNRYRIATFYVGENGIEPNTPYGVDDTGQPVKRTK